MAKLETGKTRNQAPDGPPTAFCTRAITSLGLPVRRRRRGRSVRASARSHAGPIKVMPSLSGRAVRHVAKERLGSQHSLSCCSDHQDAHHRPHAVRRQRCPHGREQRGGEEHALLPPEARTRQGMPGQSRCATQGRRRGRPAAWMGNRTRVRCARSRHATGGISGPEARRAGLPP